MDFLILFAVLAVVVEGSRMAVKKYCINRPNKLAVNGGLKEGLLKDADCINNKSFGIAELEVCRCACCEHGWGSQTIDCVHTSDSQERTDLEAPLEKEISEIGDYVPPAPPTLVEGKGKRVVDEEQGNPNGLEDFQTSEEVESLQESKDKKTSAKIFPLPPESELQAEAAVQKQRPDYNFMRSGSGMGSHHYGLSQSPLSSGEISDIPGYVGRKDGYGREGHEGQETREDGYGREEGHEEGHEKGHEKREGGHGREEGHEKGDEKRADGHGREEGHEEGHEKRDDGHGGEEGHEESYEKDKEGNEEKNGHGGERGYEEVYEKNEKLKEGEEEKKERMDKDEDNLTCHGSEGREDGQRQKGDEEGEEKREKDKEDEGREDGQRQKGDEEGDENKENDKKDKEGKENEFSLSSWQAPSVGDVSSPVRTPPGAPVMSPPRVGHAEDANVGKALFRSQWAVPSFSKNKEGKEGKKEKKDKDKDKKKGKDEGQEKKDKDKKDKDKNKKKKNKDKEGKEERKEKKGKKEKDKKRGKDEGQERKDKDKKDEQ